MLGNAPKSAANAAVGLYETVTSPIQTIKALGDMAGGAVHKALPDSVNTFIQKFREPGAIAREIEAANAVGRHYKDRFGGDEAIKNTLMNDPVGLLLDVSGLGALGAGVARGAGSALRATPSNALRQAGAQAPKVADALTKLSDATNPLVGAQKAARLPGWAVEHLGLNLTGRQRDLAKSKLLNKAADGSSDVVLKGLENPPKALLPGERVNAITAVADKANAPAFVAVGDLVGETYGAKVGRATKEANEAARLAEVRKTAGTKDKLKKAEEAREAAADKAYKQAYKKRVEPDSVLEALSKDPFIRDAVKESNKISESRGLVRRDLLERSHLVKKALDDSLARTGDFALSELAAIEVGKARTRLLAWMDSKSPEYAAARAKFTADSKPIDRMKLGQYLEKKILDPLEREKPGQVANALRNEDSSIYAATNSGANKAFSDVLTPRQLSGLRKVEKSLKRDEVTKEQSQAGRRQAADILGREFEPVQPPPVLTRVITAARNVLERVGIHTKHKTLTDLAVEMDNPATIAKLMRVMSQRDFDRLRKQLRNRDLLYRPAVIATQPSQAVQDNR